MERAQRRFSIRFGSLAVTICAAAALTACVHGRNSPSYAIAGANPDNGPALVTKYGCIACHTIPGVKGANAKVGPPLNSWSQRAYIAGEMPNVPANLIQWIENPQSVEPGTDMPNLGVTDPEARDIASYLYTLK